MAGFGRPNTNTNSADTTKPADVNKERDQLIAELDAVSNEIRAIIGNKTDKRDLDFESRRKLGTKYVQAAALAREIASSYINEKDEKLKEKYEVYCKKFSKKAEEYGSSIQFEIPNTTLEDVKGLEEVKKLVRSFIFMARNPKILDVYKIEGGFGLFMYGAPGTGKTMFAKAIANELQLPLFVVEPSDIFKSYVGESEASVKQLFDQINMCKNGAVVFIDECDELFSKRSSNTKDYKSAVTNQLLQNLNGFNTDGSKRILVAATNLPWNVDSAYLRYKRFSHHVHITPPDETAMRAILESKLKDVPIGDVTIDEILLMLTSQCQPIVDLNGESKGQSYYSSADVCGIVEDACRMAVEQLIVDQEKLGVTTVTEYPPITRELFIKAVENKKPSISAETYQKYANFRVGQ